ncbi:MAG TPA: hypothetical protein VGI70_14475, partial [Polyangiales bacterium]
QQGLVCDIDVGKLFSQGPYGLLSSDCQNQLLRSDTSAECELPKVCTARGDAELGSNCKTNADCLAGLYCEENPLDRSGSELCVGGVKLTVEPVTIPRWDGVNCPDDDSSATAYFEVPRAGKTANDFYRLPFPNDIRRSDGMIDMSGHPAPPDDLQPPAAVRFIAAASQTDGFATNPVVFFRFSEPVDSTSLNGDTLRIVDITQGSHEYGLPSSIAWSPTERSSHYICPHWIGIHRLIGAPLQPGNTYAAIVSKGVVAKSGSSYARDSDLDTLLGGDRPDDSDLAQAWDRYAPLRDYLASGGALVHSDQVLNATVFTTQRATDILPKLRAAVQNEGVPALSDLTVCGHDVKSPCEDDTGRGACHDENDDFLEIHGHIALPAFQSGNAPYENPEDGGDIALDADGDPQVQDHVSVCFALSVPKSAAPSAGYPVLLYAHRTGGAFSDPMGDSGWSAWAAHAASPSAVLAIDLPSHGSRRNGSKRPPEDLYSNFLNPAAARGNAIQGAADLMSLVLLTAPGISADQSPTQAAIRFDVSRIAMFAHSQGATHAALMIGYEPHVRSVVLSGLAGHLSTSLRLKAKPTNIGKILPFALFDADGNGNLVGSDFNPLLALIQSYFESSDPLNYARYLYEDTIADAPKGHDVFVTYGLFDSYAPERTQEAFADAAGLSAVAPDLASTDSSMKFNVIDPPLRDNATFEMQGRTIGLRTYDPVADPLPNQPAADGHFVATETVRGMTDTRRFLEQALQGDDPQIGE